MIGFYLVGPAMGLLAADSSALPAALCSQSASRAALARSVQATPLSAQDVQAAQVRSPRSHPPRPRRDTPKPR